jgi:hypothetical protein
MPPAYFASRGELGGTAAAIRTQPRQTVPSKDATNGLLAAVSPADRMARMRGRLNGPTLWALVTRHARCADGGLDPDQWFPVSVDPRRARREAAAAIAICVTCPVRDHCLALSLRHWDIGQHGVWGGLIAADRARLRCQASPSRTTRALSVVRGDDAAAVSGSNDGR